MKIIFQQAYNLILNENYNKNKNKIRRIIIIADMDDYQEEKLTQFCQKISE